MKAPVKKTGAFLLFGVIGSVTYQAHTRKEEDNWNNTNYDQVGNIAAMLNNLNTGVNKANNA